eukprot:NODE_4037_length_1945_cov_4.393289.p8 GENE.NODE_4037_length_1945_cov_4.393289~~NODE_4037_length_1945_cov_4.393289.p8  ORF type:complete len:97 (-),score=23.97 NODE_4037_length_1945_cov_4.393289:1566-1856(-)
MQKQRQHCHGMAPATLVCASATTKCVPAPSIAPMVAERAAMAYHRSVVLWPPVCCRHKLQVVPRRCLVAKTHVQCMGIAPKRQAGQQVHPRHMALP